LPLTILGIATPRPSGGVVPVRQTLPVSVQVFGRWQVLVLVETASDRVSRHRDALFRSRPGFQRPVARAWAASAVCSDFCSRPRASVNHMAALCRGYERRCATSQRIPVL